MLRNSREKKDEGLYRIAKEEGTYAKFSEYMRSLADDPSGGICRETPDGCAWNDSALDTDALDEMIAEL